LQNEPYTSPGDYEIPKIVGNKQIVISSIKTPPHYTFQRQSRNLDPHAQGGSDLHLSLTDM